MNKTIKRYIPIAEVIGETFGKHCEVVLHDLEIPQNSVVYTVNNVTGRRVGQSFDHIVTGVLLSKEFNSDYSANYYFHSDNGKLIKSSTVLIKDDNNKVIGALCINVDTTKITENIEWFKNLMPGNPDNTHLGEGSEDKTVGDNIFEIAEDLIEKIIKGKQIDKLRRDQKIDLIRFMDEKGIFLIKGAIDKVAEKLNISKVTVYSYIDEIKGKK